MRRPASNCQRSKPQPSRLQVCATEGHSVEAMPSGATTKRATSDSGRRLVAGAVPDFVIGVHDHRVILVLRDDDGLDLLADLELPARECSEVASWGVRVVERDSETPAHGAQLLDSGALFGGLEDGRRAGLLVLGDGAQGLACSHGASSGPLEKGNGGCPP